MSSKIEAFFLQASEIDLCNAKLNLSFELFLSVSVSVSVSVCLSLSLSGGERPCKEQIPDACQQLVSQPCRVQLEMPLSVHIPHREDTSEYSNAHL